MLNSQLCNHLQPQTATRQHAPKLQHHAVTQLQAYAWEHRACHCSLPSALRRRQAEPPSQQHVVQGLHQWCAGGSGQLEVDHVDDIPWQHPEVGQGYRLITMPDAMYCIVPGWLSTMALRYCLLETAGWQDSKLAWHLCRHEHVGCTCQLYTVRCSHALAADRREAVG